MIVAVLAVVAVAVLGYHAYLSLQLPGEAPVFFSAVPVVGDAITLGNDPMGLFARYRAKAAEIFGIVVMGQRMFFLTEPESFKVLFRADKSKVFLLPVHALLSWMVNAVGWDVAVVV